MGTSLGISRPGVASSVTAFGSFLSFNASDGSLNLAAGTTPAAGQSPTFIGIIRVSTFGLQFRNYLGTSTWVQFNNDGSVVLNGTLTAGTSILGNLAVNATQSQGANVSIRTSGNQVGSGSGDLHLGATITAGQDSSNLRGARITTTLSGGGFNGTIGYGIDLRPTFAASGTWNTQYGIFISPTYTPSPTSYGIFVDTVDHGTSNNFGIAITRPAGTAPIALAILGAIAAGGNLASAIQMGTGTTAPLLLSGSGVPTVQAPQGSVYLRTDGSSGVTRVYVATDAVGTWTAINTVA